MKCSNPNCNRGIGLVAYQRGWFDKRRYCSNRCRDDFTAEHPNRPQQEPCTTTYFEWLLLQTTQHPQPKLRPSAIRVANRFAHDRLDHARYTK